MQLRAPRAAGELQVHFVPIGSGDPPPTVIFVEDVGRMRQQAQQMKLVALGRLTASIAHEIRNPAVLDRPRGRPARRGHGRRDDRPAPARDHPRQRLAPRSHRAGGALPQPPRPRAARGDRRACRTSRNFAHEFCAPRKCPDASSTCRCARRSACGSTASTWTRCCGTSCATPGATAASSRARCASWSRPRRRPARSRST